jgi:hypothetical protein
MLAASWLAGHGVDTPTPDSVYAFLSKPTLSSDDATQLVAGDVVSSFLEDMESLQSEPAGEGSHVCGLHATASVLADLTGRQLKLEPGPVPILVVTAPHDHLLNEREVRSRNDGLLMGTITSCAEESH